MKPIYKPKGAAAEYADYALNIYTGCTNGCAYCYAPGVLRKSRKEFARDVHPRVGLIDGLEAQLASGAYRDKTIHLCFTCDPYPSGNAAWATRDILVRLKREGCHVQILTKRPHASMRDWDLLDSEDWVGTTFTGALPWGEDDQTTVAKLKVEPHAEIEGSRYEALKAAKEAGLRTWASCEPVIDPEAIYRLIAMDGDGNPIDLFKIGKLNHAKSYVDWASFGRDAEALCKRLGRDYVIKDALRKEMERGA